VTSCDIMWHHVTSCDIMWHHVTSCDIMWHRVFMSFRRFCFSCHISRLTTSDFQARFRDKLSQMSRPWQARQRPTNSKDDQCRTNFDFWSRLEHAKTDDVLFRAKLCSLNNSLGRSSTSTDMQRSTRTCRVDQVKTCRLNGQSCVKRIGSCLHPWSLLFCALLWLSLFDILLEWIFSMIIVIYCDYHYGIKHNLTMNFSCHCSKHRWCLAAGAYGNRDAGEDHHQATRNASMAHYSQWLYRFIIVMSIIGCSYNEKEVRHDHSDNITQ